jgi:hypothetical protein
MPVFSTWCTVLDVVLVYTTCGWGKPFNSKHCWETLAAEPTCVLSHFGPGVSVFDLLRLRPHRGGITQKRGSDNKR